MKRIVWTLLLVPSLAHADEPIRHVVKQGETCGTIAQRYWGDARFVDRLHAANPELAKRPPPHVLTEGSVLVIVPSAPAPGAAPDAQLTIVRNEVDVMSPEIKRGKPNDPLFRGNRVSTHAASGANVAFRDETEIRLGERTLVVILGDAQRAAARVTSTETELVTGDLRAFMAPQRSSATVGTDAARVKVYGEAQVSADEKKTTRLAVYGGSGAIDARGRTREVARGFGSKAELGSQPTAPKALPQAPAWSPAPPLVVWATKDMAIAGDYDAPDAAAFHVQIARDGIFRDVVVDTKVPARIKRLEAQPPGPGRYYMRVSAVDDDQFEGPFSPVARTIVIAVSDAQEGPGMRKIAVDPPDAFCVRVGNVALTRVLGPFVVRAKDPVSLRCAPNESDPTALRVLDR